jgi:hypothetical protein
MESITYTFPADCPVSALRGRTVTGGQFIRLNGSYSGDHDAVRFAEIIDGKGVVARIAGKPELEAALATYFAEQKAISDRLAIIGWPQYRAAQRLAINARGEYESASDRGYPVREARAMKAADEALAEAAGKYPLATLYAVAESYSFAANDRKASAGKRAMRAIEKGGDAHSAISSMKQEWHSAAAKAVGNA